MAMPPREFDIPTNATHADFRSWESNQLSKDQLLGRRMNFGHRRLPWTLLVGALLVAIALVLLFLL